uniref:Uncharacterized protein n=1 Tax=Oryzias latipes TaxID=8090 RepID=A0A3P9IIG1_ORYLA
MGSWRASSSRMDTVTVADWSEESSCSDTARLVLTSPVYRLTVNREASVASASLSEMGSWRAPSSSVMLTVAVAERASCPLSVTKTDSVCFGSSSSMNVRRVLISPV